MTTEAVNNNLNILVDPTFTNVNRLFVLANCLALFDLSKQQVLQENEDLIQQISFIGRLTGAANVFIIIEKKENTILEFYQNFANVLYK